MTAKLIGVALIGLPALAIGAALLWRRHRPVFFFFLALLGVSLGYLAATGAADDLAHYVLGAGI